MSLKIVCSGSLIRYPYGGHSLHQLQYLVGFKQMGYQVIYFEHYGWPGSCEDPVHGDTSDPTYGIAYLLDVLQAHDLDLSWCYMAEDGTEHGMPREALSQACRECDIYFNLDNINWIPEIELCRRRALVDVDPVFTQIDAHGLGGPFSSYHTLFSYGENVHRPGCKMPTGGARWLPTRQPIVLDMWPFSALERSNVEGKTQDAPFTTVINWSAYGEWVFEGRTYGQKDREFEPFFTLPHDVGEPMELAVDVPTEVERRLRDGGWRLTDPLKITRSPETYRQYLRASRAEFCVAKHGYVSTRCGWFSDRSAGYLASGRPVIVQDTGFSDFLPCGEGLLAYRTPQEAVEAIRNLCHDYQAHCRMARAVVEEYFDARLVLADLLERSL